MAGSWRVAFGVAAAILVVVASVQGYGGRSGCWPMPSISPSYAWPAPQYVYPRIVRVIPLENGCESAPPPPPVPQSKEPPLRQPPTLKPPIIKSHSGNPNKERCSVGFWNLTGRDVTLIIEGKSFALARNRKVTIALEHQFSWQADNGPPQIERVPEGQTTFDVVVRE